MIEIQNQFSDNVDSAGEDEETMFNVNISSVQPVSNNANGSPEVDTPRHCSEGEEEMSPMMPEEAMEFQNNMTLIPPNCYPDRAHAKKVWEEMGLSLIHI